MSDERNLGRPTGPSDDRGGRPWGPECLRAKEKIALKYIAANPGMYRWKIAKHLKMGLSRLSILSCSKHGLEYLQSLDNSPEGQLRPFRLDSDQN